MEAIILYETVIAFRRFSDVSLNNEKFHY